jgi:ABC transporter ATM
MVSGILAYKFGAPFAWITSLSVAAYVVFTLSITQVCCLVIYVTRFVAPLYFILSLYFQFLVCLLLANCTGRTNGFLKSSLLLCFLSFQWRTKFRKAMNKADNDASTRQIDSLINYEVSISFTNNTNIFIYYAVYFYR